MRILIESYSTCCQNESGGVQNRIRKIHSLLKKMGIDVSYYNKFTSKIDTCDILHIFKLDYETYGLIQCAKKSLKKVVISTIVTISGGTKIDIHRMLINKLPIMTTYKILFKSLELSDLVITETKKEADFLNKHYKVPYNKIRVIPNGVDADGYSGDEIYDVIGKKCEYVLQVGRFDDNKNQLNLIKALKNTGIEVVFIGGANHTDSGYYEKCVREAAGCDSIHFLGWLDSSSPLLKSSYSHANVLALPSFHETFGLVALEGGMAGAKLALSNTLPILDYGIFDNCHTFSPSNVEEIKREIIAAFNDPKDNQLIEKMMASFSWKRIIEEHIKCYSELCDERYT